VDYVGRLTAHLPSATRLLLVKADGSVSIHADDRAYKPLNWMSPPCVLSEAPGVWRVVNKAGEQLVITLEEVLHDSSHELGIDPGLVKDGVEAHLQVLLADRCHVLGDGLSLVRREFPTDIGPVDLLCRDEAGSSSSRATSNGSPPTSPSSRCAGSSPPSRSPRRPGCSPTAAASPASPSTTTRCAASKAPPPPSSDSRPAPVPRRVGGPR
jgi:hypothetical protein